MVFSSESMNCVVEIEINQDFVGGNNKTKSFLFFIIILLLTLLFGLYFFLQNPIESIAKQTIVSSISTKPTFTTTTTMKDSIWIAV